MRRGAHQDQSTARGPGRNRSKNWRKENRHQETQSRHHGRQPRSSALRNTRTALDERRDRGASQQRPDGDTRGIDAISDRRSGEVPVAAAPPALLRAVLLLLHAAAESCHRVQRRGAVDDVHVQECEEREGERRTVAARQVPLLGIQRMRDRVERDDLFEKGEALVTLDGVGEVGKRSVAPASCQLGKRTSCGLTHGQERIETRATPMMIAALTRKAMRKAVRRPPHIIPSHICSEVSDPGLPP